MASCTPRSWTRWSCEAIALVSSRLMPSLPGPYPNAAPLSLSRAGPYFGASGSWVGSGMSGHRGTGKAGTGAPAAPRSVIRPPRRPSARGRPADDERDEHEHQLRRQDDRADDPLDLGLLGQHLHDRPDHHEEEPEHHAVPLEPDGPLVAGPLGAGVVLGVGDLLVGVLLDLVRVLQELLLLVPGEVLRLLPL